MFGGGLTFGSSQGLAATQPPTQEGGSRQPRQEENMTCLPVTVRAIEVSLQKQREDDGEFQVHGVEPGMLALVGLVEDLSKPGGASVEFTLNDATGRLRARYYVTEPGALAGLEELAPGRYVSLVGSVRSSPTAHFAVTCMRLVSSADEVSYHMIEAAHAALKLRKGSALEPATPAPKRAVAESLGAMEDVTPAKAPVDDVPAASMTSAQKGPLEGAALRQAALAYVQREAGRHGQEGVSLDAVRLHLETTSLGDVQKCLGSLVDDGDLFTTIDDDHFGVL